MTIAEVASLLIRTSLFAVVVALGMSSTWRDATSLLRSPALLVRSVLSMQVLTPLLAIGLAVALPLHPGVRTAIVVLALAPVPPLLPGKQMEIGGNRPYAISLLVVSGVLSIATIPISLQLMDDLSPLSLRIAPSVIAKLVATSVLVPLVVGLLIGAVAPAFGRRASPFLAKGGMGLLVLGLLPPLIVAIPAMRGLIGDGTLAVCAVLCVVALAIGHLLGGPDRDDRTVLALSTAMRHPGIAIALASANVAHEPLAIPAILLYVIVSAVVRAPYMKMSVRHAPRGPHAETRTAGA